MVSKTTRIQLLSSMCLFLCVLGMNHEASADTINDFDVAGTPYSIGHCAQPVKQYPAILTDGPWGNYLRLAGTSAPDAGTATYDVSDVGAVAGVISEFDYRISPGNGRADGMAWALLRTSDYGRSGPVCPNMYPWAIEQPNYKNSLGIGFDIYKNVDLYDSNNNHLGIHFNGVRLYQVDAAPFDLASGWIHVKIIVRFASGLSDVTIILSNAQIPPKQFGPFPIAGLAPMESRVSLGARSGGESSNTDVDNLKTVFLNEASALPAMITGSVQGMTVQSVTCINASMPASITFTDAINPFDCSQHGLIARQGDSISVTVNGISTQGPAAVSPAPTLLPTLASITPSSGSPGSSFNVSLSGTNFNSGSSLLVTGSGITASDFTATSATTASATFTIAANAAPGPRSVTIVNSTASSNAVAFTVNSPLTISGLSPNTVTAGSAGFPLIVNGSGFLSGAVVRWNGSPLTTTFASATQLSADVTAALVAFSGSATITVANPNGGVSNSLAFTVSSAGPAPTLASINPNSGAAGTTVNATLVGTSFVSAMSVLITGGSGVTATNAATLSSTIMGVTLTISPTATPGPRNVSIVAPSGTSNTVTFTVTSSTLLISSIRPSSAPTGSPAFLLNVSGMGFGSAAIVEWNGTALSSTLISSTELTATVPAAFLASPTTADITVLSNGMRSSSVPFVVGATPLPTGWWPLDGNVVNIIDGLPGSLQGGASFVAGRVGQALSLDGASGYADLGNTGNEQVSNSNTFSISVWVRFNTVIGHNTIAPKDDMSLVDKMAGGIQGTNREGFRLLKQNDGRFWFCLGGVHSTKVVVDNGCTPTSPLTVRSVTIAQPNVWYHIAAVMTLQSLTIYVNGRLEATQPLPDGINMARNSANLLLGRYIQEGSYFNGLIDDVRIYRRALTSAEIAKLAE